MKRRPMNLTLSPLTTSLLRDTDNASRYVDALVQERARRWRRAFSLLERRGWTPVAIRAALETGATTRGDLGRAIKTLRFEWHNGNAALRRDLEAEEGAA
jgi:hypothetical protein